MKGDEKEVAGGRSNRHFGEKEWRESAEIESESRVRGWRSHTSRKGVWPQSCRYQAHGEQRTARDSARASQWDSKDPGPSPRKLYLI